MEDEIGALDERHRQFVTVCEMCEPQNYMGAYRWIGNGCPPSDRLALCKAFIAKAVWDFATTRALIDAIRHRPACAGCAAGNRSRRTIRGDLLARPSTFSHRTFCRNASTKA